MIKKITIKIISLIVISIGLIALTDIFLTNDKSKDMQITDKSITGRRGFTGGTKNIFLENKKYMVTNKIFNNIKEVDIVSVKFTKFSENIHSLTNKKINYRNFGLNDLASILFSLVFIIIGYRYLMEGEEFDSVWIIIVIFSCIQLSHFL